ncbi:MAG: hypothetical protein JSS66_09795 [Armatimonadetes bacterium]|nr:hypothetical protein [Armatimonadota bacterium]
MAKAELSVALQSLKGKAGTVVFVKGRDGTYIRPRVTPANPDTPAQQQVRTNLRKSATAYKNLTTAQVDQWKSYAQTQQIDNPPTGKHPKKTAIDAFVELAAKFLQVNPTGTIPVTPPTSSYAGDSITMTATAGTGKVTFTASAANTLGTKTELLLQKLPAKNRTPQKGAFKSYGFVAFAVGSLSQDVNVPPGYYAAGYRFVNTSTGQATRLQTIGVQQVSLALEQAPKQSKKAAA